MSNSYFQFKQFTIHQDQSAMKVTTDSCLFGAWASHEISLFDNQGHHCLDIGTGTGLLSLMVAQQNPGCLIDAVEIDSAAAEQAAQNIHAAGKQSQISIIQQDFLQFHPGKKYDIIFSNPPFYEKELKGEDHRKNKAHHNEGLLLADLLFGCKNLLSDKGRLYLLLPYKREKEIVEKLEDAGYCLVQHIRVKPAEQLDYFRILLEIRFKQTGISPVSTGEIAIKDKEDQYSAAFTGLLKEYYLYL